MRPGPVCERESPARPANVAMIDGDRMMTDEQAAREPGFGWIVLQRHGRRPLAILGRVLLHGDNRCAGLAWWSSITVHETSSARFVVSLCHAPSAEHESAEHESAEHGSAAQGPPWRDAWVHDSPAELCDALRRHDPLWALPVGTCQSAGWQSAAWESTAWRFRAAWAGLLGALFGLPAIGRAPAVLDSPTI